MAINLVLRAQPASPHPIRVTVSLEGSPLRLTVEDDGPTRDPTLREPARPADSVETAAIGGLGLKLMESFATSRDYARVGERNRLTLCFAGQGDAAAPAPAS